MGKFYSYMISCSFSLYYWAVIRLSRSRSLL